MSKKRRGKKIKFDIDGTREDPVIQLLLSMSYANWGPQGASISSSSKPMELPLFASCSMSAFYVDLLGPLH